MTTAREKIVRFYRGTEGEAVAVRLVDLAEQAARTKKFRCSGFLDPHGMEIAETVAANYDDLSVMFDGGYPGAERQKAVFVHRDFGGSPSFDIFVVCAEWNAEFAHLTHRDVLGSLVGLGIDRENVGDILVTAGKAQVLADKKMAEFLLSEWKQIGAAAVNVTPGSAEAIAPREERVKEINATVASLRADSVAAAGFGMSRSRAVSDIEAEKLKLNWQAVKNASQTIKEGDVLSMRGRGRVEVTEVRGKTKKGRIGISLRRYL
ncbi:MAG: RNA-binding protein [Schwartzia sp.]|nr:RNA-binding protein [Schwartzia sp. (in: firmicutes)]